MAKERGRLSLPGLGQEETEKLRESMKKQRYSLSLDDSIGPGSDPVQAILAQTIDEVDAEADEKTGNGQISTKAGEAAPVKKEPTPPSLWEKLGTSKLQMQKPVGDADEDSAPILNAIAPPAPLTAPLGRQTRAPSVSDSTTVNVTEQRQAAKPSESSDLGKGNTSESNVAAVSVLDFSPTISKVSFHQRSLKHGHLTECMK